MNEKNIGSDEFGTSVEYYIGNCKGCCQGEVRKDEYEKRIEIDKRREAIIKSIEEQEKMTAELLDRINKAVVMAELEDIYLPYKPKRKTKGMMAREKGLSELAEMIFEQNRTDPEKEDWARKPTARTGLSTVS